MTLRTRASKGSALSHVELDANFKRVVTQKTTTYSCLVGDNRGVIEGNHATVPFTITLGDATTMAAAETGDYEITIANIGAAAVTVSRAGADTIDGGTSVVLAQYESVALKVNSAGDGYSTISKNHNIASDGANSDITSLSGFTGTGTLSDYDEGTFTVTLAAGTSGTITINTSFDTLAYTRIGRLMTIQGQIKVSTVSSPVGTLTMSALPSTPATLTENSDYSGFAVPHEDINASTLGLIGVVAPGSTTLTIAEQTTTSNQDAASLMAVGSILYFNFSYITS